MKGLFILNADDFGMAKSRNQAIFDAHKKGFLKSTSICVNGEEFEEAAKIIIPQCPSLGVGVHLNIIEGKALIPNSSLTDGSGYFKPGFIQLLRRSGNKKFLQDVEAEFRAQIEMGLKCIKFDHADSHVHTHGIPNIFKIAAKLVKEYKLGGIRTQHEKRYMVPDSEKNITLAFPINRIKIFLLNTFTKGNRKYLDGLKTNDYIVGVGYTAMMNSMTVEYGLARAARAAKKLDRIVVEALFHPDGLRQNAEYQIPFDAKLEEKIKALGFEISNYSGI
jgi:predicted glycoside hydrolase/deacetylase ChbG (UPF0249 family)